MVCVDVINSGRLHIDTGHNRQWQGYAGVACIREPDVLTAYDAGTIGLDDDVVPQIVD